ncbi:methyltransferase domain-containing protein [Actinomadura logoneensis]|uniref:Methyltransferase domain-containing protein n=2 Tax=Actinomadura logoneensis TaxID=2293572 RepID=A0A372JJE9_9ACTN|nr:methyltransferase [Actinomadura logoneensis]RFU39984.1 methyltransferase domain-containing protein [Actinomadura logoneensis]
MLGPVAGGALARDEIVPALRATTDGSALAELIRLFWLQAPVAASRLPGFAADLVEAELATLDGDELHPAFHVEPVESVLGSGHLGYVVSDLKVRPGEGRLPRPDHVVGTGGAATSLARLVVHRPVDDVLDLGTGCGVQVLHLADPAIRPKPARITATDINPRALRLAAKSFALSRLDGVELLEGSLLDPVRDRRFDLIVSNPPFVVGPPESGFTYRESGMHGDEFCRRLVAEAPALLTEGGTVQLLANWLHVQGEPWQERVGAWVDASGCDAWVVQRDVQDPAEYAELWLRDSAEAGTPEHGRRYKEWLDYFDAREVDAVGFGWITLRAGAHTGGGGRPAVRIEELRHTVDQPVGAYADAVLDGLVSAREFSTACGRVYGLEQIRLRSAPGLVQEQIGPPGDEHPERILLRQTDRLRRAVGVGTAAAGLAGVCDGSLPLAPLLDAIAQLMDMDGDQVRAHAAAVLPELIADGFFEVASLG